MINRKLNEFQTPEKNKKNSKTKEQVYLKAPKKNLDLNHSELCFI